MVRPDTFKLDEKEIFFKKLRGKEYFQPLGPQKRRCQVIGNGEKKKMFRSGSKNLNAAKVTAKQKGVRKISWTTEQEC
jgi:hypothetical protein